MNQDFRDRLLLPVLIPVGAIAALGFVALSVSSVLLNVPHAVATGVALMLAFNLLMGFAAAAAAPKLGRFSLAMLGGIAIMPLLVGGAAASGFVTFPEAHGEEEAELPVVEIAADNLQFDIAELDIPADEAFVIHFNNEEAQPHNVVILAEEGSSEVLFERPFFVGPKVVEWEADPIPAGTYYFLCQVHPTMNGTAVAE